MSEWWTYGLADFLMFSPRAYARLLAAHQAAWWPAPPAVTVALLAALAAAARQRLAPRVLLGALAAAWGLVAADFLARRFAPIHLGATPMAWAFGLQALGLAVAAWRSRREAPPPASLVPAAAVLLASPLLTRLDGRPPGTAEWFAFTPDPTAAVTLALLPALLGWRWALPLAALPLATVAVGSATLHLLHWPAWAWPLAAGVLSAMAAGCCRVWTTAGRRDRRHVGVPADRSIRR